MSIQFHDAGDVRTALLLTMLGAAGTALGGLIVVAQPDMSLSRLGVLQARGARAFCRHLQHPHPSAFASGRS
jgi:hypothetical protein